MGFKLVIGYTAIEDKDTDGFLKVELKVISIQYLNSFSRYILHVWRGPLEVLETERGTITSQNPSSWD